MGTKHRLSAYCEKYGQRTVYCMECGQHDPYLDGDCPGPIGQKKVGETQKLIDGRVDNVRRIS